VLQNQNPVATDVTAMVTEAEIASHHAGSKFVLPGSLLLSVTDPDNDTLSIASISKPTVSENDPALKVFFVSTETPAAGEAGRYEIHTNFGDMHVSVGTNGQVFLWSDHGDDPFAPLGVGETATINFDYTVSDGNGGTDTKTVTITVDGTNNAPSAQSDFLFVTESQVASATAAAPRFVGNVLFNDHDVDGDSIAVTGVSAVSVSEHDSGLSILGITQQRPERSRALRYPD
jgi:VCBS repeat-containing protein